MLAARARRSDWQNGSVDPSNVARFAKSDKPPVAGRLKVSFYGFLRLHLHDKAPGLGCGWRNYDVAIRRRWAKLRDPNTGDHKKLARRASRNIVAAGETQTEALEIIARVDRPTARKRTRPVQLEDYLREVRP